MASASAGIPEQLELTDTATTPQSKVRGRVLQNQGANNCWDITEESRESMN